MKCMCGYEKGRWNSPSSSYKDGVDFIRLYVGIHFKDEATVFNENGKVVKLYACPKCGTVRMER